jgi:replication fork protection complex subunit Csm3/Swi3
MVEKMGHKKRMQIMRMEWINEGKPRSSVHEDSLFDEPELPRREGGEREKTAPRVAPIFETRASERPKTPTRNADVDAEMEDIYDATPRPARTTEGNVSQSAAAVGGSIFGPAKTVIADGPPEDDELGDDELDALLAEEEMLQATSGNVQSAPVTSKASAPQEDFDEDEMEAMAEMDGMW